MKAVWNNVVLAQSDTTEVFEGNHYFPADSLRMEYFSESDTTSACPFKGTASYYSLEVEGQTNVDAAWYYSSTKPDAEKIRGRVAFWKGVQVTE